MAYVMCKAYVYNPAITLNILCETQNSKPALMVHLMSEAHVLNTACKEHILCEAYACKPALILMVLVGHMSIIEHLCACI